MLGKIDDYFRNQETALKMRAYRQEVLASNIANADTPNYKARDFDFKSAYQAARTQQQSATLATSDQRHLQPASAKIDPFAPHLQYRNERQPSIDGNTVDMDTEMKEFTDNAIRYQASVMFMQRRIESMKTALTGQ
ncbi:flagellar basal body rod protein FlgB [Chitinibacter bivalviorum]|uniref:Flagellar basal body rod protein FlgB n=1 Tax=Chitinibacter bivalviorum TaxID=2739434 RepID=A0A7H9BHD2_9NEIS|nr:flagellar basal body rod protein FlgB [Chitinibacter bivalviorum]QLG88140.1 flagellar basal body rod protein FlgB [Chitinibacter bivalviorum]